jgi:hypothetical protein
LDLVWKILIISQIIPDHFRCAIFLWEKYRIIVKYSGILLAEQGVAVVSKAILGFGQFYVN